MQLVKSVRAMQRLAKVWKRKGARVGFVPTMGYLHTGHLSLVSCARKLVGRKGEVVISIYVNPTQFGPKEDFSRYPRDLRRDLDLCRAAGVDVVFAPSDSEIYPASFSTFVVEERLSQGMEGVSRPGHFRGVTTVVAKLFNIVQPDSAIFGAKDYQQAAVIKRMVRDLSFPVKIVIAPTLRETDGLAMSSRNKYLKGELRQKALILRRSIQAIQEKVSRVGARLAAVQAKRQIKKLILKEGGARLDYVEFFNPVTLKPESQVKRGVHMALAAYIGKTRLIDNARL